jgi:hypothetical protein
MTARRTKPPFTSHLFVSKILWLIGTMMRILAHLSVFILLTAISQLGGLAWLLALFFRHRALVFMSTYIALSASALWIAPMFGREALPCLSGESLQMRSALYCALNRQYVVPELKGVLKDYAAKMESAFPGTKTLALDANFPFVSGFPLFPHLSHQDGRKVDLAYFYEKDQVYLPGFTRSPVGYFAFEKGPTDCPENVITLRWDLAWLQALWPDYQLEQRRMKAALQWLAEDDRVGKIFIEPHLKLRLGIENSKIRFQGCRAARHDDHIHIQL